MGAVQASRGNFTCRVIRDVAKYDKLRQHRLHHALPAPPRWRSPLSIMRCCADLIYRGECGRADCVACAATLAKHRSASDSHPVSHFPCNLPSLATAGSRIPVMTCVPFSSVSSGRAISLLLDLLEEILGVDAECLEGELARRGSDEDPEEWGARREGPAG